MKNRFIYIFLILSCIAFEIQAQTFATRKLTELFELFPKTCLPPVDSIFSCPQITKGKSFIVCYNKKKEIEHLGISLFSPETKKLINVPVCNFIERMMLELLLQKTSGDVQSKLREYEIHLQNDGVEYGKGKFLSLSAVLGNIQNPTRFSLNKDLVYTAIWDFGVNKSLRMSFPVSRELIFGTDKKESDENVGEMLLNDDCKKNFSPLRPEAIPENELIPVKGTDFYRRKGLVLMVSEINTDIYYQRSDNLYIPLFSPAYPRESLANVLLTKQIDNSMILKITHRMYGNFTPEITIPLNRFICLFDNEFTTYCLLHQTNAGKINVSVVLYNPNYNYIHLLRITANPEQLFIKNGILTADFYTNIPLDNLKNLFQ